MIDVVKAKHNLLPVIDLFLLNEFNGRRIDYILPEYALEEYGQDYLARVKRLVRGGWLKIADPQEALKSLTIPQLKDILRLNKQKLSGKKDDLIARIVNNIPSENYSTQIPKTYSLTAAGRYELDSRSFYIENKKMNYGFLNSELAQLELEGLFSSDEIFEKLFARNILKHALEKNFLSLAFEYLSLRGYLKNHNRKDEALTALFCAIYLRLTGMENGNIVTDYENLIGVFNDSLWRDLDTDRTSLNLSDEELIRRFDKATDSVTQVPFSYFTVADMKNIILDRLHGQENLINRYSARRYKPSSNSSAYVYYSSITEKPIEVSRSKTATSSLGCLLPCLLILATIIAILQ